MNRLNFINRKKIIMKHTSFLAVIILALASFSVQSQWSFNSPHIFNTNAGNVGVGLNTPTTLLDVAKSMTEPTISVRNLGGNGGATFQMADQNSNADWKFKATNNGGFKIRDHAFGLDVITVEPNSAANVIYINAAGNLGVGTTDPTEKLSINGNIRCKQVQVSLTGWADFVFEEDYDLMPLHDVEAFIKQNKHLPGVPSADEVMTHGANLGEMDAILLQKIEELTLYLIELKKENEALKSLISK